MVQTKTFFVSALHEACGKDSLRPVMSHVFFTNGKVWATDAHILVSQDLRETLGFTDEHVQLLEGKYLEAGHVKELTKCIAFETTAEYVQGTQKNGGTFRAPLKTESEVGKYPNCEAVIPQQTDPTEHIGINHKIFTRLCNAMVLKTPDNCVKLSLNGQTRGIVVRPIEDSGQLGLIMPVKIW